MNKQGIVNTCRVASISLLMALSSSAMAVTETKGQKGEAATPYTDVVLSSEQEQQVRAAGYTAAILMHSTSDWSHAQIEGAKDKFSDLNIKVVAVTDAEFNANKQNRCRNHDGHETRYFDLLRGGSGIRCCGISSSGGTRLLVSADL